MSAAVPPWRRMATNGAAARLVALVVLCCALTLSALLVAAPLAERLEDAKRKAAALDRRAAALNQAAADRSAEARIAAPPTEAVAAATAWLDEHAPAREGEAAMLELLSTLRLLAQAAEVRLTAAAPLALDRGDGRLFQITEDAGLTILAAEARIVADHDGLVRFLDAVEKARPVLRAAALDVTARSPKADAEDERLTARVLIAAMVREP